MKSILLLVIFATLLESKMQNVTVKGIAVCNKRRLSNVLVELWERDTPRPLWDVHLLVDPNDLLASVHTNGEGEFQLSGGEDEIGSIEPFIRFTHNCNVKPNCARKTSLDIPKDHINADPYDMTYVTLDIIQQDDKESC